MKAITLLTIAFLFLGWNLNASADIARFGTTLCENPDYYCIKVARKNTWENLFPNAEQRDIVRRVNRMNIALQVGMIIAVPKNLANLGVLDVAPFPRFIEPPGVKHIFVNQKELAWGAYDATGELIWWGPVSTGRDLCPDIKGKSCATPSGSWHTFNKDADQCSSTVFPIETNGGAPMPYCMWFFKGYALHGSPIVPGYRDSHGCVRLFVEDAKWLNEEFVDLPGSGIAPTRVTVLPLN